MKWTPAVLRDHLSTEKCYAFDTNPPRESLCHASPICQRCQRCVGHCTCPPEDQRYKVAKRDGAA